MTGRRFLRGRAGPRNRSDRRSIWKSASCSRRMSQRGRPARRWSVMTANREGYERGSPRDEPPRPDRAAMNRVGASEPGPSQPPPNQAEPVDPIDTIDEQSDQSFPASDPPSWSKVSI